MLYEVITLQGKYNIMHGLPYSPEEKEAWSRVTDTIEDFASFDRYVRNNFV